MIAAKRTSRDAAPIILPVLLILTALVTYISLELIGLVPVVGTISADATWVMPITVLLWLVLLKYVYGLIRPVIYLTEIFPERIVFSDSSNPENPIIIERDDVVKFYVEPKATKLVASSVVGCLDDLQALENHCEILARVQNQIGMTQLGHDLLGVMSFSLLAHCKVLSPRLKALDSHITWTSFWGASQSDNRRYVRLACDLVEVIVPGISRPARGDLWGGGTSRLRSRKCVNICDWKHRADDRVTRCFVSNLVSSCSTH